MANKDGKSFGYHNKKSYRTAADMNRSRKVNSHIAQDNAAHESFENELSQPERLVACAIIRNGEHHSYGYKSHGQIRSRLGDVDAYENRYRIDDTEGFMTSHGRFVNRRQAMEIAEEAGQYQSMQRELLSSDINW